jgi:Transposase DDE domain group 1
MKAAREQPGLAGARLGRPGPHLLGANLLLDGDLKVAEPKTLRYRLWHQAARVVHHARCLIVRLQRSWPWATALAAAFARLRTLPLRC